MSNELLFIILIALFAFNIGAYALLISKIDDIADKQFDANEVMNLWNMKFNRPIITSERADVREIKCSFEIPYEVYRDAIEGRIDQEEFIKKKLFELYEEQIVPYIEYVVEDDFLRWSKVVKSRLRVVDINEHYKSKVN